MRALSTFFVLLLVAIPAPAFDLQGHRGARGLLPENTLPAFARALEIGVTTLEADLSVTRDDVVVLSHDPLLNPAIIRSSDGKWLQDHSIAIRSLSLAELKIYDAGRIDPASPYAKKFPQQVPIDGTPIPTLRELIELVKRKDSVVRFNIETKISPDRPGDTPDPETFARLVVEEVQRAGIASLTTIQSFDWRTLIAAKRLAPEIQTVCLTMDTDEASTIRAVEAKSSPWLAGLDPADYGGSIPKVVKAVGCETWSPLFSNLNPAVMREARDAGLSVVPWTVNTPEDMVTVISLGVEGLITDYPDVARTLLSQRNIRLQ